MTTATTVERAGARAGKYLTFQVAAEYYGLPILAIQEIIGLMPVTRMPQSPPYARGVINLRGRIIPVLDLHAKFGLEPEPDTERTCIVVVEVGHRDRTLTVGAVVDEVSEVLDISQDRIEDTPAFGATVDSGFILGMAKIGSKVIMLLDTEKVLKGSETTVLEQIAAQS